VYDKPLKTPWSIPIVLISANWVDERQDFSKRLINPTNCREIGTISDIQKKEKIATVSIKTKDKVTSLNFDLQKFEATFLPFKGMKH